MDKIKILIIAGTMNMGGIENQMMHLLRKADPNRFQIDFTSTLPDPYYSKEMKTLGSRCILIPEMKPWNPLPYCRALYRTMKHGHYDIVHSHELFHSGIVIFCAYLAGIKGRFCHAHNCQDGNGNGDKRSPVRSLYNCLMGKLIRSCSTHLLACSTASAEFLFGKNCLSQDRCKLVFNSVDTRKFLDACRTAQSDSSDGWRSILHVGRVTAIKNQLFLTEIAAVFKQRGRKLRILCAGGGDEPYIRRLQDAIAAAETEDYIRLLGPREDIALLMAQASAFVLPSKYEGMPLAVIEAQTAGLPCVCADTFSQEVDFGLGGIRWLSLSDNPYVWADDLEEAVASGRNREEAVLRAIQEKGFDASAFADRLCALYTAAAEGEMP